MSRFGSCIRVRWSATFSPRRSALSVLTALVLEYVAIQGAQESVRLPLVPLLAALPVTLLLAGTFGISVGRDESIHPIMLEGLGVSGSTALALAIGSSMASPIAIGVFIPLLTWYWPLGPAQAVLLALATHLGACAAFQIAARSTSTGRRVGRRIPRFASSSRIPEPLRWGVIELAASPSYGWALLEACIYGTSALAVSILIHLPRGEVAAIAALVSCTFLGLTTHNVFGHIGPAFWLDLAHAGSGARGRTSVLIAPLILGGAVMLLCALIDPDSAPRAVGVGSLSLGTSMCVGQISAVLAPYALSRTHPRERRASPLARILRIQSAIILLSFISPILLMRARMVAESVLGLGVSIGVAALLVGVLLTPILLRWRARQVLEMLTVSD